MLLAPGAGHRWCTLAAKSGFLPSDAAPSGRLFWPQQSKACCLLGWAANHYTWRRHACMLPVAMKHVLCLPGGAASHLLWRQCLLRVCHRLGTELLCSAGSRCRGLHTRGVWPDRCRWALHCSAAVAALDVVQSLPCCIHFCNCGLS